MNVLTHFLILKCRVSFRISEYTIMLSITIAVLFIPLKFPYLYYIIALDNIFSTVLNRSGNSFHLYLAFNFNRKILLFHLYLGRLMQIF